MRIAVADTGALISLEKISGGFDFIRKLYEQIYVPPEVLTEAAYYHPDGQAYLQAHGIADLVVIEETIEHNLFTRQLDTGERYAISLALKKGRILLIEEHKGTREASELGILTSSIWGRIVYAFRQGRIDQYETKRLLFALQEHNRISIDVYQYAIGMI